MGDLTDHDMIMATHASVKRIEPAVEKLGVRVFSLEKWRWLITGGVAAVGGIFGWKIFF